jgi:hypothetical protein
VSCVQAVGLVFPKSRGYDFGLAGEAVGTAKANKKVMKLKLELLLAGIAMGRVLLHLCCLMIDHHIRFHLAGIGREFCHN